MRFVVFGRYTLGVNLAATIDDAASGNKQVRL
jgi:hypothetical protein